VRRLGNHQGSDLGLHLKRLLIVDVYQLSGPAV